MKKGREQMRL